MIGIVDYGLGNISAFANIYKQLNIPFKAVKSAAEIQAVDKLILPGVGAFDYAMQLLNGSGMREVLDDMVLNQKVPVLGVCVGMQIMANSSEEGILAGLGWVDGTVRKIDITKLSHKPTIPHMGWNQVRPKKDMEVFAGIDYEQGFYFLHSYYFSADNTNDILAVAEYAGEFSCAVHKENIYGFQFHPEKSLLNGVTLLKNFANL
ncbi:imidazole glycerol phosphate synthase subunit HisH [Alishewanella tabrizica]|uniref:Imidazole glycerol phosphate synthase subunit HisH n=1 Tax=Alishewanella tabrizica TaxID=671278 RepID=A0ABQ2WIZ3_9ALTE|nr:imidazole glycerol phosphate synthase subunit HisH [Alishewanella tabrizica]GGW58886.1 imidazole glycerol phosphate synthase subunit HisH 2 [Alishewanella tabrizica]